MLTIYAISGLGADRRVFEFLTLRGKLIYLDWIEPEEEETIERYALRLAQKIDQTEPYVLIGLSFGGLIAVEISKHFSPALTILISSVEVREELPLLFRGISKTGLLNLMPSPLFDLPRSFAHFIFGTENKTLINQILDDTDSNFAKWAILQLINWQNNTRLSKVLKIHGDMDKVIPVPKSNQSTQLIIKGGGHFVIVDQAKEVSTFINQSIEKI